MSKFSIIILFSMLLLQGCSDSNIKDLKIFVKDLKTMPPKVVLKIPVVEDSHFFTYKSSGLRSPFAAPNVSELKEYNLSILKPDSNRTRHDLEQFPFDDIVMVGTLHKGDAIKGMINVDKNLYLVSEGDYIGKNHGKIVKITDQAIHVRELVPSGVNAWIERPRQLILKQD